MNYTQLLNDLEELTRQLGVEVRYEKGDFEGGFCILRAQKLLVINKRLPEPRRASTLAQAIAQYGIETTYIKPSLRQYIEDEVARAAKSK